MMIVNELIPKLLEDLQTRILDENCLPLSYGYGLDLTTELHCRGINMRHLGLIRSKLYRKLPGFLNIYFSDTFIRTSKDLREEVQHGDKIIINGLENYIFTVKESETIKITPHRIPVQERYTGLSMNRMSGIVGSVTTTKLCDELRSVFLGEIIARSIKSMIRLQLRDYAKESKGCSLHFKKGLIIEYLNIVTGSNVKSSFMLQEMIYEIVKERFGSLAIRENERYTLQDDLTPCTIYTVKRIQDMLGVKISLSCLTAFRENPTGFCFNSLDILETLPVIRHAMPALPYAEAMSAFLSAQQADRDTYIYQIVEIDQAPMLLKLTERKGARIPENFGKLGNLFEAHYSRGIELERTPGPLTSDEFSRAAGFRPGVLCAIETKFNAKVMSAHTGSHYSIEMHCQVQGGVDTARYALVCGRCGFFVSRENQWTFIYSEGRHDLHLRMTSVILNEWVYLVGTYDGVTVRCYVNGKQVVNLEVEKPVKELETEAGHECQKKIMQLEKEEREELLRLEKETEVRSGGVVGVVVVV